MSVSNFVYFFHILFKQNQYAVIIACLLVCSRTPIISLHITTVKKIGPSIFLCNSHTTHTEKSYCCESADHAFKRRDKPDFGARGDGFRQQTSTRQSSQWTGVVYRMQLLQRVQVALLKEVGKRLLAGIQATQPDDALSTTAGSA